MEYEANKGKHKTVHTEPMKHLKINENFIRVQICDK